MSKGENILVIKREFINSKCNPNEKSINGSPIKGEPSKTLVKTLNTEKKQFL